MGDDRRKESWTEHLTYPQDPDANAEDNLCARINLSDIAAVANATAAQRAEAFLRTLNLWITT